MCNVDNVEARYTEFPSTVCGSWTRWTGHLSWSLEELSMIADLSQLTLTKKQMRQISSFQTQ